MTSAANSVQEYLASLPDDRKNPIAKIREALLKNLPKGFTEIISHGMITYVVPHEHYPPGYHVTPQQPLPFIALASQKNFIALYHMGIYAHKKLLQWFTTEYTKHSKVKLDMGKTCIRFKKPDQIPIALISELATKISVDAWIDIYEREIKK
jgi:hypothetical protein